MSGVIIRHELKRLNLELSALCSYACAPCPNTYMGREKGHMDLRLFKSIYDEVDHIVERVSLWNYGEPMLNPNIEEIIDYTLDKKPFTSLSTTGMNFYKFKNLSFLSNLDELIISVNGLDQETYEFHQQKGNLEKVLIGLEKLKTVMNPSKTNYVLQFLVNSGNIDQISQVEDFAKKYAFHKIVFKSFNDMDNTIETKNKFIPKEIQFTRNVIEYNQSDYEKYPCNEWMVINWNGDVNICCWDYEGKIIIGNVKEQGVLGTWQSVKMKKLKNKLKTEKILDFCGGCIQNTIISEKMIHNGL
jgi:radical SAM protein with 4Fe4S-binding SPASM domain